MAGAQYHQERYCLIVCFVVQMSNYARMFLCYVPLSFRLFSIVRAGGVIDSFADSCLEIVLSNITQDPRPKKGDQTKGELL